MHTDRRIKHTVLNKEKQNKKTTKSNINVKSCDLEQIQSGIKVNVRLLAAGAARHRVATECSLVKVTAELHIEHTHTLHMQQGQWES